MRYRKWNEQKVIQALVRLAKKRNALDKERKSKGVIHQASKRYFGNWWNALTVAGITFSLPVSWNKKKVILKIQEFHSAGKKLTSRHICRNYGSLYSAACNHVGSWGKAVKAAGIDYTDLLQRTYYAPKRWGKDNVIAEIQRVNQSGGRLNYMSVEKSLVQAARNYFGSWEKALKVAGIDYGKVKLTRLRPWTRKEVIACIKKRKRSGLPLYPAGVSEDNQGLYLAVYKFFPKPKSWRKALLAAGVDPALETFPYKWTRISVVEEILRRRDERLPLNPASLKNCGGLISASRKFFGGWKQAIKAAGLSYKDIRKTSPPYWTKRRVIRAIQQMEIKGYGLSMKDMRKNRPRFLAAVVKRFGGWAQAVYAAGLDYQEHSLIWSSKAWVRQLTQEDVRNINQRANEMARKRRNQ